MSLIRSTRSRYAMRAHIESMDPATEYEEISRLLATHEFPWDINQALSFALYRTYAVPSIGGLLAATGEFTERVQKRYDDTGLILDAILEHGLGSVEGKTAVKRMNQMHRAYDISNDDMLYVLSTFVVMPVHWLRAYGWRELTEHEISATVHYYRALGKHMNIRELPEDYAAFERFLAEYERDYFAFDPGGRAVADSTLDLMTTFPPNNLAPKWLVQRFAIALMDTPLVDAFDYRRSSTAMRLLSRGALRLRGKVIKASRPRRSPRFNREMPQFRSYPAGYEIAQLGTFPTGCPVPHSVAS